MTLRVAILILAVGCTAVDSPAPTAAQAPVMRALPAAPRPEPLPAAPIPSASAEPPTDLDVGVPIAEATALREFGARAQVKTVRDVFVIAGTSAVAGSASIAERAIDAYYNGRFARRPSRAILVYLFPSSGPYEAYCRREWGRSCVSSYGFYLADERRIVMNVGPGVGTLTHELVHPILEEDFPQAPDWIEEGIASLYEGFAMPRPGEIRGVKNWRHPRLMQSIGTDSARLDRLFGMSDSVFRGDGEDLHYALARTVCLWLEQQGWLWPFYQRWRDGVADDPTGERAFTAVTGMSPAAAHEPWVRWARRI